MYSIKNIEIKKLFKELDYLESEYNYINEIIIISESNFKTDVNFILDSNSDLKDLYKINDTINDSDEEISTENESTIDSEINNNFKLKKFYREIVKRTHPDKVKNSFLNDLYVKATESYNINDEIGIYKICNYLDIDFDLDSDILKENIVKFKNKINFLENNIIYKWYISDDKKVKNKLLLKYIESNIS